MAKVTMDIAELDSLRKEIESLKEKENKLSTELYEVKADRRVMVIKEESMNVDTLYFNIPYRHEIWRMNKPGGSSSSITNYTMSDIIKILQSPKQIQYQPNMYEHVVVVPIPKKESKTFTDKSFINFDDAISEIRKDVEKQFIAELTELRSIKQEKQIDIESLKKNYERKIGELQDQHLEELSEKEKEYMKNIKKLELKEEEDLKQENTNLKLENEKLKQELGELSKNWFTKLLKK